MPFYFKILVFVVLFHKEACFWPMVPSETTTLSQEVNNTLTPVTVLIATESLVTATNSTEPAVEQQGDYNVTSQSNQTLRSSRFFSSPKNQPNQNSLTCSQLPQIPVCGRSLTPGDDISPRVIGGSVASPHEYPWVGMLRYYKKLFCAVTVISDQYVLTAAHCVIMMQDFQKKIEEMFVGKVEPQHGGIDFDYTSVLLGVYDTEDVSNGTFFSVESYKIHENFSSDSVHDLNDIALIKLGTPIVYTNQIQPVCLPNPNEDFTNYTAVVTGWGQTVYNGSGSQYLKQGKVRLLADDVCLKSAIGDHFVENPQGMLCAYEYKTDACHGDSGGPLQVIDASGSYVQVGIVSWGKECAQVGYPGVYTEVANYINWIQQSMQIESCKGFL